MGNCARKKYATSISAKRAAKAAGGKGQFREVELCGVCTRWHVKAGVV